MTNNNVIFRFWGHENTAKEAQRDSRQFKMSVNFILRCFYVAKLNKFVFDNFVFILSVLTFLFKVFFVKFLKMSCARNVNNGTITFLTLPEAGIVVVNN